MDTIRIEIAKLKEYSSWNSATWKQVFYIRSLMLSNGMTKEFQKHFMVYNEVTCNRITKRNASRLIDALKNRKKIVFIEYGGIPKALPISQQKNATSLLFLYMT